VLKRIPQDCTFEQGKLLEKISRYKGKKFSYDLSAATDRFPIIFIGHILEGIFPKVYVDAWKYILVGLPFLFEGKQLKYSVGNPMGAFTSWSSFTLAHHFIVYSSCIEAGVPWRQCLYAILGDDIVIAHDKVAEIY
jgi:hypothetical protein